jgi:hypothetical protein
MMARPHPFFEESTMTTSHQTTRHLRCLIFALSAVALAAPASQALAGAPGGGSERVQGSGNIKKEARSLAHFSGVAFSLPGDMEIKIGNTEGVTIETDDNLLPLIETVIENSTLKVRPAKRNLNINTHHLKIVVQAREVDSLALGGSGSIQSDPLRAPKLQVDLGGSGSINVKGVETEDLSVTLGGSGNLKVGGGTASNLSVSIGGSGNVDLGKVKANAVSANVAGSGAATVWARDALSVTIAGSGDVNYYGDPKVSKTVVGSGTANRIGSAPR